MFGVVCDNDVICTCGVCCVGMPGGMPGGAGAGTGGGSSGPTIEEVD